MGCQSSSPVALDHSLLGTCWEVDQTVFDITKNVCIALEAANDPCRMHIHAFKVTGSTPTVPSATDRVSMQYRLLVPHGVTVHEASSSKQETIARSTIGRHKANAIGGNVSVSVGEVEFSALYARANVEEPGVETTVIIASEQRFKAHLAPEDWRRYEYDRYEVDDSLSNHAVRKYGTGVVTEVVYGGRLFIKIRRKLRQRQEDGWGVAATVAGSNSGGAIGGSLDRVKDEGNEDVKISIDRRGGRGISVKGLTERALQRVIREWAKSLTAHTFQPIAVRVTPFAQLEGTLLRRESPRVPRPPTAPGLPNDENGPQGAQVADPSVMAPPVVVHNPVQAPPAPPVVVHNPVQAPPAPPVVVHNPVQAPPAPPVVVHNPVQAPPAPPVVVHNPVQAPPAPPVVVHNPVQAPAAESEAVEPTHSALEASEAHQREERLKALEQEATMLTDEEDVTRLGLRNGEAQARWTLEQLSASDRAAMEARARLGASEEAKRGEMIAEEARSRQRISATLEAMMSSLTAEITATVEQCTSRRKRLATILEGLFPASSDRTFALVEKLMPRSNSTRRSVELNPMAGLGSDWLSMAFLLMRGGVSELTISDYDVGDGAQLIAAMLPTAPRLTALAINRARISAVGAAALLQAAIQQAQRLHPQRMSFALYLNENGLKSVVSEAPLADALRCAEAVVQSGCLEISM